MFAQLTVRGRSRYEASLVLSCALRFATDDTMGWDDTVHLRRKKAKLMMPLIAGATEREVHHRLCTVEEILARLFPSPDQAVLLVLIG
jgi:hypothetical protein